MSAPLIDNDGVHGPQARRGSFTVTAEDIAVGGKYAEGFVPFRLEFLDNAEMHMLRLSMKGCMGTAYNQMSPIAPVEFQLPGDADENAQNPPDRQCKPCEDGQQPGEGKGCWPSSASAASAADFDAARTACSRAAKYIFCDQVKYPTTVGDGRCDEENNFAGCWDGGDCCKATCRTDALYECSKNSFNSCHADFRPGLDGELYVGTSPALPVGKLAERTEVPTVWFPQTDGRLQYFNTSGFVKTFRNFRMVLSGFIKIPDAGEFTFFLASDGAAVLYIDGHEAVNNDGLHSMKEASSRMWLSPGFHQVHIAYADVTSTHGLMLWCGDHRSWIRHSMPRVRYAKNGYGIPIHAAMRLALASTSLSKICASQSPLAAPPVANASHAARKNLGRAMIMSVSATQVLPPLPTGAHAW